MGQDSPRQLDYVWVNAAPTIPVGTPSNGALVTKVSFQDIMMEGVEIYVPPGPGGQVGIQLQLSGGVLLPFGANPAGGASYVFNAADWLIVDDVRLWYDLGIEVDQTFAIVEYNTGTFPHTVQFRFKTTQLVVPTPAAPVLTLVPIVQAS